MRYHFCLLLFAFTSYAFGLVPPPGTNPAQNEWKSWIEASKAKSGYVNSLVLSESPYLKQHAHNPIDWKTLPLPEQNNRLLFISIGYASCHWCHQMNEHTFMNDTVAEVLNEYYISIKVDRDEYPAFDYHYLQIQQAVHGEGGWPISIIALPDGSPVWIGSFSKAEELKAISLRLARIWRHQPQLLVSQSENIKAVSAARKPKATSGDVLDAFLKTRDAEFGGKQGDVKFPNEGELLYLLALIETKGVNSADEGPVLALMHHLDALAQSPLFDGVNGGFYRYSTRRDWRVPHFEKMLYTQAQLLAVYAEAFRLLKKPLYLQVATRIFDFLERDMLRTDGLYKTSINADWQGIEGGYYLWSKQQLDSVGVDENISLVGASWQYFGLDEIAPLTELQRARSMPETDDRALTGLNGLVLWALTKAKAVGIEGSERAAVRLAKALIGVRLSETGNIYRICYREDECLKAEVDDLAYLLLGLASFGELDSKFMSVSKKLFMELRDKLDTADVFSVEDHESIAPLSAAIGAAFILREAVPYDWLNPIGLSALSVEGFQLHYNAGYTVSSFAKGHGKVLLFPGSDIDLSRLALLLDDGWHVNSSQPVQDYLIPTAILGSYSDDEIFYPKGDLVTMAFSEEPLSLYENVVEIGFKMPVNGNPVLRVQACDDRQCLLPEKLSIKLSE